LPDPYKGPLLDSAKDFAQCLVEISMLEGRIEKARLDLIKTVDFNYHDIFRLFTDLNRVQNLDVD